MIMMTLKGTLITLRRLLIFGLVITSPLWLSAGLWLIAPHLPLQVTLVDYTVPFDNYAEHKASTWSFNHLKLSPPNFGVGDRGEMGPPWGLHGPLWGRWREGQPMPGQVCFASADRG